MKVSVIIPSLYEVDGDYLKTCVESLRRSTYWDIIVVTNGSKTKPDLSHIHGITKHIHTSDQGQCVAVNIGAQAVAPDTDYIMVSNSDMYYAPGWDRNINLRFHRVFSPNLVEPTDNAGSAAPFLKLDGGIDLDAFKQDVVDEFVDTKSKEMFNFIKNQYDEPGFNLPFFIEKEVWDTIGGYDEAYDPWGSNSDSDLQAKINIAGITPMRTRDVLVYHFGGKSGTFSAEKQAFWQHNWDYFTEKFGFNRDTVPECDVWMNKNILPEDKSVIKYKPDWSGKYEDIKHR